MKVYIDTKAFEKTLKNVTNYSFGFIEGIDKGKSVFLERLGSLTVEAMSQYIDAAARENPSALHHVYEWYQSGSPESRLFTIQANPSNFGLTLSSSFRQSSSIPNGSSTPFFNKASVMESGQSVIIKPKKNVLAFESDGQTVFTKNSITVDNPGGDQVAGAYQKVFDDFIVRYFKQSFLTSSGILTYLSTPKLYKSNLIAGSKSGRLEGVKTGYTWITNTTIGVENV